MHKTFFTGELLDVFIFHQYPTGHILAMDGIEHNMHVTLDVFTQRVKDLTGETIDLYHGYPDVAILVMPDEASARSLMQEFADSLYLRYYRDGKFICEV